MDADQETGLATSDLRHQLEEASHLKHSPSQQGWHALGLKALVLPSCCASSGSRNSSSRRNQTYLLGNPWFGWLAWILNVTWRFHPSSRA